MRPQAELRAPNRPLPTFKFIESADRPELLQTLKEFGNIGVLTEAVLHHLSTRIFQEYGSQTTFHAKAVEGGLFELCRGNGVDDLRASAARRPCARDRGLLKMISFAHAPQFDSLDGPGVR